MQITEITDQIFSYNTIDHFTLNYGSTRYDCQKGCDNK